METYSSRWALCKDYGRYQGPEEPAFLYKRVNEFYKQRVTASWGGAHIMRGRYANAPRKVVMDNNDYLGLAAHPRVIQSRIKAVSAVNGEWLQSAIFLQEDGNSHRRFELDMAAYLGKEDTLICQSEYAANVGLIQSIAEKNVPVYIDMLAHMSLWEGINSANGKACFFPHNNIDKLESLLQRYGSGVIVVDSVYSTDGSVCPLSAVVSLGERYNCVLVVDESHALGLYGPQGKGLLAELDLSHRVHFITASLSKAFANRGGLIACSARNREYLIFESLPAIFSSAVLPHEVAVFNTSLAIVKEEFWRRDKAHANATYLRTRILSMGYNVTASEALIISLESGTEYQTILLQEELQKHGTIFCAPETAKDRALVRFCVHCDLRLEQLDYMLFVCKKIRDKVGMKDWKSTKRLAKRLNMMQMAAIAA